jgi:hypothetical protein
MPKYLKVPQTIKSLNKPRKVNYFNGQELGQSYYVSENKLYKKMKNGDYREILPQHNEKYEFYFLKNKIEGKSRVGVKRIDEMEFKEEIDNEIENENDNELSSEVIEEDIRVNEIPENEIVYEITVIDGDTGNEIYYKKNDRIYNIVNEILKDETYQGIYYIYSNRLSIIINDLDEY